MIFRPHGYQRYCIQRMLQEPALALFLGMGLGKTVTTLTVLNDLKYNRFQMRKCLVIAPKKVRRTPGRGSRRSGSTCGS